MEKLSDLVPPVHEFLEKLLAGEPLPALQPVVKKVEVPVPAVSENSTVRLKSKVGYVLYVPLGSREVALSGHGVRGFPTSILRFNRVQRYLRNKLVVIEG